MNAYARHEFHPKMTLITLQTGRALAVISVASVHLSSLMGFPQYGNNAVFLSYTKNGDLGVNFFFVLSGFIILFVHEKDIGKPQCWKEFIFRRFFRIFPIYWLYTLFIIFAFLLGFSKHTLQTHSLSEWATSILLVRFSAIEPPLTPAWTLFHEVGFYLAFSTLLLNRKIGIAILSLFAIICTLRFQFPLPAERTAWNVYTAAHNLDFFLGMASYLLYKYSKKWLTFGAGFFFLILACMNLPFLKAIEGVIFSLAFALLVAGAAGMEREWKFHIPRWLYFTGDASYSIYLVHISFQIMFLKAAMRYGALHTLGPQLTYILVLLSSIACGGAAYLLIERPMSSFFKKWRSSARLV